MKNALYSTFAIITLSLTLSVVNCGVIRGATYTVDANQPTGGNTFQTLEELANSVTLQRDDVIILCNDDDSLVSNLNVLLTETTHVITLKSNNVNSPRTITRNAASIEDGGVFFFPQFGTLQVEGIVVFDGNEVSSSGSSTGRGGAFATITLTFAGNDHIVFSDNLADGGNDDYSGLGGAIFAESGLTFSYNNSGYSFISNKAQGGIHSGHGGAIYVGDPENPNPFAGFYMSANSHFKANQADNDGGAIYLSGVSVDAIFYGDTFFQDNIAGRNGGAIYINGDGGVGSALLRLYTHSNHVVFSGNTAQGVSNSIFMEKNSSLQIIGDHNVYFNDPILSGPLGGNALQKFGSGIVQFVGNSVLNSGGLEGNVQHTEGIFRIVDGATFSTHNAASDATFSMDADAILAGGGTISADKFTLEGIISPDSDILLPPTWNDTTQSFGIVNSSINAANNIGKLTLVGDVKLSGTKIHVDLKSGNVSDLVMVDGTISFDANVNTINVTQFKSGTFDVLKTTGGTLNLSNFNVRVKNSAATGSRLTAVLQLANGDQTLQLKTTSTSNTSLTWTGSSGSTWDIDTTSSWIDSGVTTFIDGDQVLFNDTPALRNITIVDPGVIVTQMTVTGSNDYTFSGGGIRATTDSAFSTLGTRTGKLIKSGTGVLTLNTANEFEGGIELSGGTIVLGNDKALGTWGTTTTDPDVSKQGMVTVTAGDSGTIKINDDRTITNRLETASGASLTLDVAAGKTLTISGVQYVKASTTDGKGGAIDIDGGTLQATGGNLVMTNNVAQYGGAIFSIGSIDFSALSSATFTNNESRNMSQGGGGGAIYFQNTTSQELKLGNNVRFQDNSAERSGGAIAADGDHQITIGSNAKFVDNTATNGSGGAIYFQRVNTLGNAEMTIGTAALFKGNTAGGGGAISIGTPNGYAKDIKLTVGSLADFLNNSATSMAQGEGGAIYAYGNSGTQTVLLGTNTHFQENSSAVSGGAIYIGGAKLSLSVSGNTFFEGNTSNAAGGAIYAHATTPGTINLNAASGHIAFTGNKANGNANSIYAGANIALNISGDYNVYFNDPISTSVVIDQKNSLIKNGDGTVQFIGDSVLNTGTIGGRVEVNAGTFRLVDGGSFATSGDTASFTLATFANLAGAGSITASQGFALNGTISLDSSRLVTPDWNETTNSFGTAASLDLSGNKKIGAMTLVGDVEFDGTTLVVDLATGNVSDQLIVQGAVTSGGVKNNTVDISTFVQGEFDLVTSTNMETDFDDTFNAVTVGGQAITNPRLSATLDQTGNILKLITSANNVDLIWVGGDAANDNIWHIDNTNNWKQDNPPTYTPDSFVALDYVIFDGTGGERDVLVGNKSGTTVTAQVAGMEVSSSYEFSGGSIVGTAPTSTGQTVTGKLEVTGNGTVVGFDNTIDFANGMDIGTGAEVVVRENGSLVGTNVANGGTLTFEKENNDYAYGGGITGNGTINKNGNAKVTFTNDSAAFNGAIKVNDGTLALADGKTLGASSSTIAGGATLDLGAGSTIGGPLTLNNGGTLQSGNLAKIDGNANFAGDVIPDGTLYVDGHAGLKNDVNYHVDLIANASKVASTVIEAQSFDIETGTTMTVNDTAVELSYLGSQTIRYDVLKSQLGISGTFSNVTGYNSLFDVTHGIDGLNYYLAVKRSGQRPFDDFGSNNNTQEVVDALNDGLDDPDMKDLIDEFSNMTDDEIRNMIDQLRGTELAAAAQADILSSPWLQIYRKYELADDEQMIRALFRGQSKHKYNIRNTWGQGYYRYMDANSDGNAVDYHEQRGGVMVGMDWNFRDHSKIGVTFGYGNPRVSSRFGHVETNDFLVGIYSRTRVYREWYGNVFVGCGLQKYDYSRRERDDRYTADYNGRSLYSSVSVSRSFRPYSALKLTPQMGLDYAQSWNDAFLEKGGPFVQQISKATADRLSMRIGIDAKYQVHRKFDLTGRMDYAVLINGDQYTTANSRFAMSQNSSMMELRGVNLGRSMFTIGFGGEYHLPADMKLFGNYDFDLGNRTTSHTGFVGMSKRW